GMRFCRTYRHTQPPHRPFGPPSPQRGEGYKGQMRLPGGMVWCGFGLKRISLKYTVARTVGARYILDEK
ncbi:hypothetical protein, partial [Azospirillum brasilense]|uniref:hypothetical protein n=1 Tax=Azospirillum brasilense TaxID=192 RepID=UPI001B3B8DB6